MQIAVVLLQGSNCSQEGLRGSPAATTLSLTLRVETQ